MDSAAILDDTLLDDVILEKVVDTLLVRDEPRALLCL